jgi:penicillin-binding protein 1B
MPTSGPNSSPSTKRKNKGAPAGSLRRRIWASRFGRWTLLGILSAGIIGAVVFGYFYLKFSRMIDEKLAAGPYGTSSRLFATPRLVMVGEEGSPGDFANYLRRAGYSESRNNRAGWYLAAEDRIDIYPGPDAYDPEPAALKFENGRLAEIISLRDNTPRTQFRLEPELVTSLHGQKREKRRVVKFADIPKVMVDAVLAAEDKRFFAHSGFDPLGILRAVYVDVKERRNNQGASTLTMQLSRTLLLTTERSWKRKAAEALITLHLEQRLSKEEIFEHYANTIYIGHHGSFSIHGFAEGANVYLGKDLARVTLPEAAFLAGMVQSPYSRNPFKYPERAKARRNTILKLMRENGAITEEQLVEASTAPLTVSREGGESGDAPYFVDLVNDYLQSTFQDRDFQAHSYRVYTTIDMNLQRDAVAAVRAGLVEVDAALKRRFKNYGAGTPEAQVALVALDAQNGEVRALVGGRSYGQSQLNRALAKRQPGSAFKPFVYAAALGTGIGGDPESITPVTKLVDEPTTFWFDNKPYEPGNFKDQYYGPVTLRQALAKSLNIPTVKLAEKAGYKRVAQLARDVGLGNDIKGTPAVALGSYAPRGGGRLYRLSDLGTVSQAVLCVEHPGRVGRGDILAAAESPARAGSAGSLPDDQSHGRGAALGHGRGGPRTRLLAAGGGQDGDVA